MRREKFMSIILFKVIVLFEAGCPSGSC
jgi:hypothetical protein